MKKNSEVSRNIRGLKVLLKFSFVFLRIGELIARGKQAQVSSFVILIK